MDEVIKWDDKYLTYIEIIDCQHKKIFKGVNELFGALENNEEKEKILDFINQLDFYTTSHFDVEEKYMTDLKYPEYPDHKKAHERFKGVYQEIRNNYSYEKSGAIYIQALHLNHTLADWLDYHLQNEDQRLAEFLRNKELK